MQGAKVQGAKVQGAKVQGAKVQGAKVQGAKVQGAQGAGRARALCFVLLPKRWVVERSLAWVWRFRRLAKDYERLPETVRSLHILAFVAFMLQNCFK